VAAGERFDPNVFEPCVYQRGADVLVFERRGDRITRAAAEPDRNIQETGWGMIRFVSNADPIVVDSSEEKSADLDRIRAGQHGGEKTASLGAAGKSAEGNRPARRLRPILVKQLKRCADQRHPPRLRIFARSNRRIGCEHNPTFINTRLLIEWGVHRVGAMIIRSRYHN